MAPHTITAHAQILLPDTHMSEEEIFDILQRVPAFRITPAMSSIDAGSRERLVTFLNSLADSDGERLISRFVSRHFLTDEALQAGRGLHEITDLTYWLADAGVRLDFLHRYYMAQPLG